jgi:hypothetical protein
VRPVAALAFALATFAVGIAPAGAARSPRLETLAYRAPDTKLAQGAVIRRSDLAAGWTGGPIDSRDDDPPDCPWQDYSDFTITGEAGSRFTQGVATVATQVEVFRTKAQARGDFRVGTRSGTAGCEGRVLAKSIGHGTTLVSAKVVAPPSVGERATALRFVFKNGATRIYLDAVAFVRGRAVAVVSTFNTGRALGDVDVLARLMDVRLQSNVA